MILTMFPFMKRPMTFHFDYYHMSNFDFLLTVSNGWLETYNYVKGIETLEEWEQTTLDQLILAEKVFDV
jgi:hypothetical protein